MLTGWRGMHFWLWAGGLPLYGSVLSGGHRLILFAWLST
jgi:hypothetical protein